MNLVLEPCSPTHFLLRMLPPPPRSENKREKSLHFCYSKSPHWTQVLGRGRRSRSFLLLWPSHHICFQYGCAVSRSMPLLGSPAPRGGQKLEIVLAWYGSEGSFRKNAGVCEYSVWSPGASTVADVLEQGLLPWVQMPERWWEQGRDRVYGRRLVRTLDHQESHPERPGTPAALKECQVEALESSTMQERWVPCCSGKELWEVLVFPKDESQIGPHKGSQHGRDPLCMVASCDFLQHLG